MESECQSLVSPKTLLNGPVLPLGLRTTRANVTTEASPLVVRNCPLLRSTVNTNSLILPSTTFSSLSNQIPPNDPAHTGAAECFSLEMDDRCGSYDDVLLDACTKLSFEAEGQPDVAYTEYDDGCSVLEESDHTHSCEDLIASEHRKTKNLKGSFIHPSAINESTTTAKSTKIIGRGVNVRNLGEIRQQSVILGPSPFVCRSVTSKIQNDRLSTGLEASVKLQARSHGCSKVSETTKSQGPSLLLKSNRSTPGTSLAPPSRFITPHAGHQGATKTHFKIFSENPSCSSSSSTRRSWCAPTKALSSVSVNTLSTPSNASMVSVGKRSNQKITSPLCLCGRRAKRQLVSNGGPNHGRGFYCCPVRRSVSGGPVQKGCEFFKWESALMRNGSAVSPAANSSVSLCGVKSSRISCPPQSGRKKSF